MSFNCLRCKDKGYIFYPSRDYTQVKKCDCQPVCSLCGGTGKVRINKGGYTIVKDCKCSEISRRMGYLNRAGIPSLFFSKEISNFSPDSDTQGIAHGKVRTYISEFPAQKKGLLFMGNTGSGKTHLAVGLLKVLIMEKGESAIFKDQSLLLQEIKLGYEENIYESLFLKPLWSTDILLIDDIGKGRNTPWELDILDDIISRRYNSSLITICTTNYFDRSTLRSPLRSEIERYCIDRDNPMRKRWGEEGEFYPFKETLEEKVGDRIYSRLREMCEFIPVIGVDHRKKG